MPLADGRPPTNPPVRHRSTRGRPAKAPLSEDAIVDAALAILRSDGLDAVTMRRVAAALDTGAASLYVYVPHRDGLLQSMLDRVTATIKLEAPDPARWREQLHGLLERTHDALRSYPGVAAIMLAAQPMTMTEPTLQLAENMLGLVLAAGIDPQEAAWACDVLLLLVTGVTNEEDARHAHGYSKDDFRKEVDALHRTFAALSPERFPMLVTHAAQMVAGDSEERFRFAIDVVIDGVLARAGRR